MEFGHHLIDQARIDLAPYGDIEELKVEKCFAIAVSPRKGGIKKKEAPKPANEQAERETEQQAAGEALNGGNPTS
jgi:translation initiation factor IF-3